MSIFETCAVRNRFGRLCALNGIHACDYDCTDILDAPDFFPSGAMKSPISPMFHANTMDAPELLPTGCTVCHGLPPNKSGYVQREGN